MDSKFPSYRKWWSLYETLQKVYNNTVRKSVVNLAFSLKHVFFLIKSGKKKQQEMALLTQIHEKATFLHQSAKWGM
jgi:hypothetical protein